MLFELIHNYCNHQIVTIFYVGSHNVVIFDDFALLFTISIVLRKIFHFKMAYINKIERIFIEPSANLWTHYRILKRHKHIRPGRHECYLVLARTFKDYVTYLCKKNYLRLLRRYDYDSLYQHERLELFTLFFFKKKIFFCKIHLNISRGHNGEEEIKMTYEILRRLFDYL